MIIFEAAVSQTHTNTHHQCTHTQPLKSRQAFLLIINTSSSDQYIRSVIDGRRHNAQRTKIQIPREGRRETEEYVEKEAVMGSSPELVRSIEITYLLNLTDPRSVARNGDQCCS